ncbi:MAG: D-2-hydroxyacid dehydrogenase [Veillonellales bacterium]
MPGLNILVLNKLAARHIAAINNAAPDSTVLVSDLLHAADHIADCDILVAWGWMNICSLLPAAAKLKWIHALSAGVENLLSPELQSMSTILTNSKGIHGIPVSEHVLALMLAFTRGLNFFIRHQEEKNWQRSPVDEIHDKTIGIVGLGSIGREFAKKAKGLGMNVVATKRKMTTELFVDQLYSPDQLNEMLAVCDFVVVALPLLPETREMFKFEQFTAMKPTAYFINISRGAVVREADLETALSQGLIKGAGLDVFEHEPLAESSPLWDMPNVIITPHIAALSPLYLDRAIKLFTDNLTHFIKKEEMLTLIDKEKGY